MKTNCERCNRQCECKFYGRAATVEDSEAQNGEWLCDGCVYPRMSELDDAIEQLESFYSNYKKGNS